MPDNSSEPTVTLAHGQTGSALLHRLLRDTADRFAEAFSEVDVPERAARFRKDYANVLPHFEAARADSPSRHVIAKHLAAATQAALQFTDASGTRPIAEALAQPVEPLPLTTTDLGAFSGWDPAIVYRGERFEAAQLPALAARLAARNILTPTASDALRWLLESRFPEGRIDLRGRRIVVFGANAEMAATRHFLEAGAHVLWLDVAPPPAEWIDDARVGGRLTVTEQPADLLRSPREILATIIAFAEGTPLDLCLYAYAPGQLRELRLAGVMNAIVDACPPELRRSVTLLVSPTTPATLAPSELEAIALRRAQRPAWEATLSALGLLGRGAGYVRSGDAAATRSVVTIQGTSYQAAQYLTKVMCAETWANAGAAGATPMRVSANTAPITRTRSLDHPLFAAAFGGSAAFGVETFTPRQSRRLSGMLAVHDWLAPRPPVPGEMRIHGGIHTLPYPLEPALRIAAAIGFARAPRLLRGLLPG